MAIYKQYPTIVKIDKISLTVPWIIWTRLQRQDRRRWWHIHFFGIALIPDNGT